MQGIYTYKCSDSTIEAIAQNILFSNSSNVIGITKALHRRDGAPMEMRSMYQENQKNNDSVEITAKV